MMLEMKTTDFLEQLSSKAPVPGGGGASAAVGAFAAALGLMVANLTVGKKKYADVEDEIIRVRERLEQLRDRLISLTDEDAEGFGPLSLAYKLPKETPAQAEEKERVLESALNGACVAPVQTMEVITEVVGLLQVLAQKGSWLAVSDVGTGILFAQAALEGASLSIFINTKMMKDRNRADELNRHAEEMIEACRKQKEEIYQAVLEKIR